MMTIKEAESRCLELIKEENKELIGENNQKAIEFLLLKSRVISEIAEDDTNRLLEEKCKLENRRFELAVENRKLEKGFKTLQKKREKWQNRYYRLEEKINKEYVSKEAIREKIKKLDDMAEISEIEYDDILGIFSELLGG